MKIKTLCAAAATGVALMLASGSSFAQTCASPLPLISNNTHTGTTCGGQVGIDLGGIPLVHPSIVFSFVAEGASGSIETSGDATISAVIAPDCSTAPFLIGNSIPLGGGELVDGETYLFIVTSEELSAPDPQICGEFNVVTGTLPVELQSFSVD